MRHTSNGIAIDHVAIAILRKDDQIVLVQQRAPHSGQTYWVLPGGLVEPGELAVDALIREAREEAGVQITAIAHLVCCSQIDRPAHAAQTVVFIFEVAAWHGTLNVQDPDAEVLDVALVPFAEAIQRLQHNGGWPGIQAPLLAYLQETACMGAMWFYREDSGDQRLVASVPAL